MPTLAYQNKYIPTQDPEQGKIIIPPDRQFPVPDYKGQLAFAQAMGKVGEVLMKVEDNQKYAATQYYKSQANRDLGLLLIDLKQMQDPYEQEETYTKRSQEIIESYREPLTKSGVDFDNEFLPEYTKVRNRYDLEVAALRAATMHENSKNMTMSMIGFSEDAARKAPLDERGNEIAHNQLEGRKQLIESGVGQYWTRAQANAMIGQSEQIQQQRIEGYVKQLWNSGNSERAVRELADKSMLPGLDPVKREELLLSSQTMARVEAGQRRQEQEAQLKKAHDDEERAIGMLVLNKQYGKAMQAVRGSKFLTGDELAKWGSTIETQSTKVTPVDPVKASEDIIKINGMISREENPDNIRRYIVQTPNLNKEDKEQYLNKLETKYSGEINEGRKQGYHEIENIIIPKRGMMATLMKTPSETVATSKAQMALDEWIDGQVKANKQITSMDVRKKAISLAEQYQVPMSARILDIKKEGERMQQEAELAEKLIKEEAKKAAEAKKAMGQPVRGKIQ